jgi:hypothetical protein
LKKDEFVATGEACLEFGIGEVSTEGGKGSSLCVLLKGAGAGRLQTVSGQRRRDNKTVRPVLVMVVVCHAANTNFRMILFEIIP